MILEPENFEVANYMVTPLHIKPSWYLAPYYAILRAIPSKGLGALAMLGSILVFALLPFLDRSPVKSMRYKGPLSRMALGVFVVAFIGLLCVGGMEVSPLSISAARICSVLYFSYFLLMPIYTHYDTHKPAPDRLT